jgi:hypothetical protein
MSRLPKIRIKLPSGNPGEYIYELEQARDFLNFREGVFVIDGQGVQSYDDLVRIATQDKYKDKEIIDIVLLHLIDGG